MRYTQEETLMHEDVMKMVPTFKDVVTKLNEDPVPLESFIAYVCMHLKSCLTPYCVSSDQLLQLQDKKIRPVSSTIS